MDSENLIVRANESLTSKSTQRQTTSIPKEFVEPRVSFKAEDFSLIERIGSGKFGKVFKAVEKQSGTEVALKLVKKELLD